MRPRHVDMVAPPGKDVYEVYVLARSKPGVLHELTGITAKANVDILSAWMQVLKDGQADVTAYLEMGDASVTIDQLLDSIKASKAVVIAKAERKDKIRYASFLFPILMGDKSRGFFLRSSAWDSIVRRLVKTYGTGGQAILYEEGFAYGQEAAAGMLRRLGQPDRRTALENFAAMFRATGKGIVEIDEGLKGYGVTIREPVGPMSDVQDHFLVGIVAGAISQIYQARFMVQDLRTIGDGLNFSLVGSTEPLISSR